MAVEHPVFDVWLTSCKTAIGEIPTESSPNEASAPPEAPGAEDPAAAEMAPDPNAPAESDEVEILPWATPPNAASR